MARLKLRLPATRKGRIALAAGGGAALVAIIGSVAAFGWFNSVEQVPFESGEAVEEVIETLPPEEQEQLAEEFAELEAYEDIADADLLALIEEARLAGKLVDRAEDLDFATSPTQPDEAHDTILIIGADESGALADVLIYLIDPADGGPPVITSIPRDLYVESPCTGLNSRINANLNGCGPEVNGPTLVATAVGRFTGIEVDHFALFDFDGFARIVDTLGGVELCFDYPTRDRKAHLDVPAGCFVADGRTALAYARSRQTQQFIGGEWQGIGADDFSRQAHQQEILFKLLSKLNLFDSVTSFLSVAEQVANTVRLDDTWTLPEAVQTAWEFRNLSEDDAVRVVIEADNYRTTGGAAVLVPTKRFSDLLDEALETAG